MRDIETTVLERIEEARGAATFVVGAQGEVRDYRPGQFLTVDPHDFPALGPVVAYFEAKKGRREQVRAYSLCSTPDEPHLAFTVKEEHFVEGEMRYPPILSSYLVHALRPGDRLSVRGFSGGYVLREAHLARSRRLVHLCAGSGIVPSFSILKHALTHHPGLSQVLLYSNRSWDAVIYRAALDALARAHRGRLEVRYCVTRDPGTPADRPDVHVGRITRRTVAEAIGDPGSVEVFLSGPGLSRWERELAEARDEAVPARFVETMLSHLEAAGVPAARIHKEVYG